MDTDNAAENMQQANPGLQVMPRYKCHKEVWALKIKWIINAPPDATPDCTRALEFDEPGYAPMTLTDLYFDKHKPEAGGYYVVYEDGYRSFSPASAFESGYARIFDEDDQPARVLTQGNELGSDY